MSQVNQQIANINQNISNINNTINEIVNDIDYIKNNVHEKMIDSNADKKIKDYLLLDGLVTGQSGGLYQNGEGHKGIAVSYGNAKTGESGFTSVGFADSKGRLYNEDTPFAAYSTSKPLAGLILTKCLEENLINTINEPLSRYVPELTGNAKYIKSVTVPTGLESDPSKWTYELADYNLATMTFANLLTFSFGYLYSAYYTGTFNSLFMHNPSFYTGLVNSDIKNSSTIGRATALHLFM